MVTDIMASRRIRSPSRDRQRSYNRGDCRLSSSSTGNDRGLTLQVKTKVPNGPKGSKVERGDDEEIRAILPKLIWRGRCVYGLSTRKEMQEDSEVEIDGLYKW